MIGKKTLRLTTAALLAGATLGAPQLAGVARHASADAGTIVITDWQFPDGCGQGSGGTVVDKEVCAPMESALFSVDQHANYFAQLATRIPTLQNGGVKKVNGNLVVTYTLKPNLKWSDGVPETADDLIFGTKLYFAAGNTTGYDQISPDINSGMKKIDSRTVQVTYKGTYASYYEAAAPVNLPQHYLEKKYGTTSISGMVNKYVNDAYISTSDVWDGPYKLDSFTDGQGLVESPNPYYTAMPRAAGRALPTIKFQVLSSTPAAYAADLLSNNAGVNKAEDFQEDDLPTLKKTKFHLVDQPAFQFEHLELNTTGALKDVRLRQAVLYAIDKPAYYKLLFPAGGDPTPFLTHGTLANADPWADKSIAANQYNPVKAKQLLTAAGYSTNYSSGHTLSLRFATTNKPARIRSYEVLARQLANVGIHLLSPAGGFPKGNGNNGLFSPYGQNGVLAQGRFDVGEFAWSTDVDPQAVLEGLLSAQNIPTASHHPSTAQNYARVDNPQLYSLLTQARTSTDTAQRHALFNRFQQGIVGQAYWVMLYDRANITVDDGTIGNYKANPTAAGNSWNAYEYYKL